MRDDPRHPSSREPSTETVAELVDDLHSQPREADECANEHDLGDSFHLLHRT